MNPVDATLADLALLDRPALAERWQSAFKVPAPKSCQATLLRGALAWHAQVQALRQSHGPREADRAASALRRAAGAALAGAARAGSPLAGSALADSLLPGTRLLREWQGRTHHVTVLVQGFEYDGRIWRSLSAIAHSITGTRWSGPLFFGLRS